MIQEEIKEKMSKGLSINRMPNKTHYAFVKLAKEEFCGDYGMLTKHLMDLYQGLIHTGLESLEGAVDDLNTRLSKLEESKVEEKPKGKSMLGGDIK